MLKLAVILGIAVAGSVCVILFCVWFYLRWRKSKSINDIEEAKNETADNLKNEEGVHFDLDTLRTATSNFCFSNTLDGGGGRVLYKGTLKSGKEIAIKRLRGNIHPGSIINACHVLARIQHPNLVKLLGFCSERGETILVYEYLPNGSLASFLHDASKHILINWETWYKIILGIARGLDYLHDGPYMSMVLYGLKTSNILLDEDMNPKIGDFGVNSQNDLNACSTVGAQSDICTRVFVAPEYCSTGFYSVKSDVYSFGVIVLEIVSDLKKGKAKQSSLTNELVMQAIKLWHEDRLSELINPALQTRCLETDVIRCIQVGILCVQVDKEVRPTMGEVVLMLTDKAEIPIPPVI